MPDNSGNNALVQGGAEMIDLAKLKQGDLIDRYNRNLLTGGVCGTITGACGISTACGTFYVVEEKNGTDRNGLGDNIPHGRKGGTK